MAKKTFKRVEKKYVINKEQKSALIKILLKHMNYDPFCENGKSYYVQNIYYDTVNNSLISKSIDKPIYKAKIRVRHYVGNKTFFLEWKQKTLGVVSKRRIALTEKEFENFIIKNILPKRDNYLDKQIINEFAYYFSKNTILPALYLCYERVALFDKNNLEFRITFDSKIFGSRTNFKWEQKNPNIKILDDDLYVLEIKLNCNFPLWLTNALTKLKIYPHSFSKYGEEYKSYIKSKNF